MASFNLDSLTVSARVLDNGEYAGIFGHGRIAANGASGIRSTGSVLIRNEGVVSSFSDRGIEATAPGLVLENSGTVSGATEAVAVTASGTNSNPRIVNSGDIRASVDSYAAILVAGYGADIVNTGTITSLGGIALHFSASSGGNVQNRVFNNGLIYGGGTGRVAVEGSDASERIENVGTLSGAISLSGGSDVLINAGVLTDGASLGVGMDFYDGRGGTSFGRIDGNAGNDLLRGGDNGDDLAGGNDHDTLRGGTGSDTLSGGNGNDLIQGGGGDDVIAGGAGVDTLRGGDGDDEIDAGQWNDLVKGGPGDDLLLAGFGSDTMLGGAGDDSLYGSDGNDRLFAGAGDDSIQGGAGIDSMRGAAGDDTLVGGDGNDSLDGGKGTDVLTGGPGNDTFVFRPGGEQTTVTDFENSKDRVDLRPWGLSNYADLKSIASVEADTGAVRIDFGGGDILTLTGIGIGALGGADFLF